MAKEPTIIERALAWKQAVVNIEFVGIISSTFTVEERRQWDAHFRYVA